MAGMREKCRECGHSWGVTMLPRTDVLCSECARPTPSRRPAHYWAARMWNFPTSNPWPRSPEWWDEQTSRADLRIAAEFANSLEVRA
ncbi:hypothetical protein [Amycolatopsis sp. DSM 110486]|uniref:hypothetical protein n=1 Tax=Amycolatopsis sp. DSM 110486 TaxID=2865832 RepID=UPI001C696360|nr:hypothetical protein [Amycolatopsis sp. DSM 110486]QYN17503.1 hypothetical protein K1T34_32475 [Amycolatopsis sp. DSM 110486]